MTLLSKPNAFNPGADLWIVPDSKNSAWTKRLDWHLNFQLVKAMPLSPRPLETPLLHVLRETNQSFSMESLPESAPLMIASSTYFPNKWTVHLSFKQDLEEWCVRLAPIWRGLTEPTLRVFLPTQIKPDDFSKAWAKETKMTEFTAVLDS